MQVKATSRLREVVKGTPKELFSRFHRLGVYRWKDLIAAAKGNPQAQLTALRFSHTETFLHYFQGAATAYGILIGRTWQFEAATELKTLRCRNGGFHPPQSYRYVGSEELVKLMD